MLQWVGTEGGARHRPPRVCTGAVLGWGARVTAGKWGAQPRAGRVEPALVSCPVPVGWGFPGLRDGLCRAAWSHHFLPISWARSGTSLLLGVGGQKGMQVRGL